MANELATNEAPGILQKVQDNWIELSLLAAAAVGIGFAVGTKTGTSRGLARGIATERTAALAREKREFKRGVIEAKSAIDRVLNDLTLKIE